MGQGPGWLEVDFRGLCQHFRIHNWNYLQTWARTARATSTLGGVIFFTYLATFSVFGVLPGTRWGLTAVAALLLQPLESLSGVAGWGGLRDPHPSGAGLFAEQHPS